MKDTPSTLELKAKANRLHLAHQDMVEVKQYIDALETVTYAMEKDNEWSSFLLFQAIPAIYIAIIIVYTRPFMNSYSKGEADSKLIPEGIQLFENDRELEDFHNQLIELRSTAVAHADWTQHSTRLITNDPQFGLKREHSQPDYAHGVDMVLLRRLVNHVEAATKGLAYDMDVYYQTEIERAETCSSTNAS